MITVLYKMDVTGSVRKWTCECSGSVVVFRWGQMRKTTRGYEDPATWQEGHEVKDSIESARTHAESLIRKKIYREGYSAKIPRSVPIRPMLAVPYTADATMESFAVQPKLDGFRCIGSSNELRSRDHTIIRSVPHISEALAGLPEGVKLDGELYIHGVDLQTISSYVKRNSLHPLGKLIEYHVYDILLFDVPFVERHECLTIAHQTLTNLESLNFISSVASPPSNFPIKLVPTEFNYTHLSESSEYLVNKHREYRDAGYEGMIIRDTNGMYECDKRSPSLLKYKDFVDDEFLIVDIKEGKNRCAIFVCKRGGRTFDCSPAFTTGRKQQILTYKENYIGKYLHVKYSKLTPDGSPFHPTGLAIYDSPREKQNPVT